MELIVTVTALTFSVLCLAERETTTPRNCEIYKPICGSDRMTYSNECVLEAENCKRRPDDQITIDHEGACYTSVSEATTTAEPETTTPRNCDNIPCTFIYKPVCGSDGMTYSNECVLEAENCKRHPDDQITIEHEGACYTSVSEATTTAKPETTTPRNCDNIPCTFIYKPVCGSDGMTYSNECVLEAENCKRHPDDQITIEHERACYTSVSEATTTAEPETTTPRNCDNIPCMFIYKPVCGSDGMTYSNECVLEAGNCKRGPDDQITIEHKGACYTSVSEATTTTEPATTTPRNCDNILYTFICKPVCGSDGMTYSNECVLEAENCKRGPDDQITIEHEGACYTSPPESTTTVARCSIMCPAVYDPVCGSDGETYNSSCHLEVENCQRHRDYRIIVKHNGVCATNPSCET